MRHSLSIPLSILLTIFIVHDVSAPAMADVRSRGRNSVNANRNSNKNVNVNRNTNKNVNVNVDVDHRGGYYSGGCCYHEFHPVAAIATAAVAAAVIGSIVTSLPPSGCSTAIVNGLAYQRCGNNWYQPQISGSSTTYIVVNPPG